METSPNRDDGRRGDPLMVFGGRLCAKDGLRPPSPWWTVLPVRVSLFSFYFLQRLPKTNSFNDSLQLVLLTIPLKLIPLYLSHQPKIPIYFFSSRMAWYTTWSNMEAPLICDSTVTIIVLIVLIIRYYRYLGLLRSLLSPFIVKHLTYPYCLNRHRMIGPWTRAYAFLYTGRFA